MTRPVIVFLALAALHLATAEPPRPRLIDFNPFAWLPASRNRSPSIMDYFFPPSRTPKQSSLEPPADRSPPQTTVTQTTLDNTPAPTTITEERPTTLGRKVSTKTKSTVPATATIPPKTKKVTRKPTTVDTTLETKTTQTTKIQTPVPTVKVTTVPSTYRPTKHYTIRPVVRTTETPTVQDTETTSDSTETVSDFETSGTTVVEPKDTVPTSSTADDTKSTDSGTATASTSTMESTTPTDSTAEPADSREGYLPLRDKPQQTHVKINEQTKKEVQRWPELEWAFCETPGRCNEACKCTEDCLLLQRRHFVREAAQMELMSLLLLCVLVALLPQTLGKPNFIDSLEKRNNSYPINKKTTLLLNMYGTNMRNENSELHQVFSDINCQNCHSCMGRAIKAHNSYYRLMRNRPNAEELQEDILMNQIVEKRIKRDATETNAAKTDSAKPKTVKPKRGKSPKLLYVTKYYLKGQVYALKFKVTYYPENKNAANGSCQVYSVNKSLPCESPESNKLLNEARRKSQNNDRNETPQAETTTPEATTTTPEETTKTPEATTTTPQATTTPEATTTTPKATTTTPEATTTTPEATTTTPEATTTTPKATTTTPKARLAVFEKQEADNSDMPNEFMFSTEEIF